MTLEDAIAAGMEAHETKHSMKRRTPWHNYSHKGTYMLTLVVRERAALLGTLVPERTRENSRGTVAKEAEKGKLEKRAEETREDSRGTVANEAERGKLGTWTGTETERACVELSALGTAIEKEEILKIHRFYPQVEVWKLCIMPDHLHMIVRVNEDLGEGKHLGKVIAGFKTGCSKAAVRLGTTAPSNAQYQSHGRGHGNRSDKHDGDSNHIIPLFEEGYCDKILKNEGQLDNWKHYLDDNPRRLMMKLRRPELFTILTGMDVAGEQCQVVGNRFLLDIPDKMAVIVHRHYTEEENERLREKWLACGERGGVLVSAAISPKEKSVLREAMDRGYRIILLRENGFPKLYKPAGEAFDACAEGLLLQISPWNFHMGKSEITREQCLYLNAMAEKIAGSEQF